MSNIWRTIRVFISSTFRDMQAERDWLVRFVFPRLREELLTFRIHLEDVDLRWGVTSDQDAFDLCMKEIDNCHPRFLCILGGRYGWVPPPKQIPADLFDAVLSGSSPAGSLNPDESKAIEILYRQANSERIYRLKVKPRITVEVESYNALGEIVVRVLQRAGLPEAERSITASEIYYGALDKLQKPTFRFFYFREDNVTNGIPDPHAKDYRELAGSPAARFLETIKARIRSPATRGRVLVAPGREEELPLTWRDYHCEWDVVTSRIIKLQRFGELVYTDLLASVVAQFGDVPVKEGAHTDAEKFAEDNAAMEAFVEARSKGFVLGSRETVHSQLLAHARDTGGNGYVCLIGRPGSGKSALLAYLSQDATLNDQTSTLLIRHFVGASSGSTDARSTLRRICHELKSGCSDITADIPEDPEKLRVIFPAFLRQACARRRVVILLDAINQFDLRSHSVELQWLPEDLPPNARVILSDLDSSAFGELSPCSPRASVIVLKSLTATDSEEIFEQFRQRFRKTFEPNQRAALQSKSDAGIPLYLLSALEELRTLGTHEEITRRIDELPATTSELFEWILKRLESDDGFRDASGKSSGQELVSQFAMLLATSRHGLSQLELVDLLEPCDPQGNVAALLHLLGPYLMWRGELLDFYHGQFREAVETKYPGKRLAANASLANYFRRRANSGDDRWCEDDRALSELPFHLACADRDDERQELLASLPYLAARVATGAVHALLTDYELPGRPLLSVTREWRDFLQKHRQRLAQYPRMLVALVNHEGFPSARAQVGAGASTYPWLRTSPEPMPARSTPAVSGLRTAVVNSINSPVSRIAALASSIELVFCLERLGEIRVLDSRAMCQLGVTLFIRRERPLILVSAPDARSLAVFFESGDAVIYRCVFGADKRPEGLEATTTFQFLLPEYEDPVAVWHNDAVWFQSRSDHLVCIETETGRMTEEPLPDSVFGELTALVFTEKERLVAVRQNGNAVLVRMGVPPIRRNRADVAAACACDADRVAVAFTDGTLAVYDLAGDIVQRAAVRVGMIRGTCGWDGARLLWLEEGAGFRAWLPIESVSTPVLDDGEIIPPTLQVSPRYWSRLPDGGTLVLTSHSVVAFRLLDGDAITSRRLDAFFGGDTWRAVWRHERTHWLVEGKPSREILIGSGDMGRLCCSPDGCGHFFIANVTGECRILDLATLEQVPIPFPILANVAVGDGSGGCWFADREGNIYFTSTTARCIHAGMIGNSDVRGARLHKCGQHLVWWGYSSCWLPRFGSIWARTFVFFRCNNTGVPWLDRAGEKHLPLLEGICEFVTYDVIHDRMITLWKIEGREGYRLRIGSIDDFLAWRIEERDLSDLPPIRFLQAALSADGSCLGVLSAAGELICVSVDNGKVIAVLAMSIPFIALSATADDSGFWTVEGNGQVYHCELRKPS